MEAVLDQHGTATAVAHAVAQNAVVIQIGTVGIGAGLDAAVGRFHAGADRIVEACCQIGVAHGIGNGVVRHGTAHRLVLLGRGRTAGRVGMKRQEENGVIDTCQLATLLEIGVVLDLRSRGHHLKAAPLQLCLQRVCENEILRSFIIALTGGVGIAELSVTGIQHDQTSAHMAHFLSVVGQIGLACPYYNDIGAVCQENL